MLKTISTSYVESPIRMGTPIEKLVGNTPLLDLSHLAADLAPTTQLLAKAEWFNPGGSVKDRAALNIIRSAEARGQLGPGKILIDATSGNTGIGYAMFAAARGHRAKIAIPANASPERIAMLRAYGAELILTDPLEGTDGAIRQVEALVNAEPERYYYADQYSNPANWEAHYHTTGPEIWQQTSGRVTHFVAGLGTSGTMMGAGRYLKVMNPNIHLIAVQPDHSRHGLEGLKHFATAAVPPIFEAGLIDEIRPVQTEAAYVMARRLAQQAGLLVGVSAAAAVHAALNVARELREGIVVTILPDGGMKYLSEKFWVH